MESLHFCQTETSSDKNTGLGSGPPLGAVSRFYLGTWRQLAVSINEFHGQCEIKLKTIQSMTLKFKFWRGNGDLFLPSQHSDSYKMYEIKV